MPCRYGIPPFCIAVLCAGPALSGEAAQPTAGQRQLLEPPRHSIASPITDRFVLRGLFYRPVINTAVRHDSSAGVPGTPISGEGTLGLADRLDQFGADMTFRIGERQRIRADFYKMTRSGDRQIQEQIRFGNDVYQIDERVVSSMDLRRLGLNWSYSVLRREKFELGLGLSIHLMQLQGELQVPARFEREQLDVAGPYPALTADATWRMTRRFSLNLAGNYLDGGFDGVDGNHHSVQADLQFRVRPNLALGLGYARTRYRIDSETTDFIGTFRLKYQGPQAFVRVSF